MTRESHSRFNVGDVVRIVDTPYRDCPFTWVNEMSDYCGKEAMIVGMHWIASYRTYGYILDCDGGLCTWCENCFAMEDDIEESDFDMSALLS